MKLKQSRNRESYYGKRNDSKKSHNRNLAWGYSEKDKVKNTSFEKYTPVKAFNFESWMTSLFTFEESEVEKQFNESAAKWRKETGGYSTMIHIAGNNNYLDIIGLGPDVIPYILKDLVKEPDFWFVALEHIAKPKQNPVPKAHIGDLDKMAEDWIAWGKENKYI